MYNVLVSKKYKEMKMYRDLNGTNWGTRINHLGYALAGGVRDNIGRSWRYRVASYTCGPVGYFDSLGDLTAWVRQVEEVRLMIEHPDRHALGVEVGVFPAAVKPLPFQIQSMKP